MSLTQRPRHSTQARLSFASLFSTARHVLRRSFVWKTASAAVAAALAIGMVGAAIIVPSATANTVTSDQNQPSYWQELYPGSSCYEMDDGFSGSSYVLSAPPANTSYVAVIVKAGSPSSTGVWNSVFDATHNTMPATDVTVTTYESTKDISHIILCTVPTPPPSSGPSCVESPVYSYTYTVATASGVITVTAAGAKAGDTLCIPLYVRAATWTYDLPTTGNSPSWPQTLEGFADVTVNTIGTFPYAAPDVATCKQHDIYATFDATGFAKLALPTNLLGSHNPHEPAFLHETLNSAANGTNSPTYTTDPSAGCLALAHEALASVASQQTCDSTDGQYTDGTITIPASENVTYKIGTTEKSAGTYSYAPGSYTITVTPAVGYKLSGPASYDLVLTDFGPCLIVANEAQATPSAQTCNTSTGDLTSGYIKIPTSKHVTFYIGDSTVAALPDSVNPVAPGDYVIHVYPDTDYTLTGPVSYTVTVLPVDCPMPVTIETDPEVFQPQCVVNEIETTLTSGYITVAVTDHVTYSITGTTDANVAVNLTDVAAQTDLAPGHYTVTATAEAGFVLAGEHVGPWEKIISAYDGVCQQGPTLAPLRTAATSTNQVCTAGNATGGTITVGHVDDADFFNRGIDYFINGTKVTSQTTTVPAGTYTVTAVADPNGDASIQEGDASSWTITVAAPSTDCAQLKTLAFTGADGSMGGMLIFALFLLLGGAGVYTASRFRSRES